MASPPTTHQPFAAEPSPPTLSLPTKLLLLHTDGWNRYFAESFRPSCAASMIACVHVTPAVSAMNTAGFFDASVVIASVIVGAVGSIFSVT